MSRNRLDDKKPTLWVGLIARKRKGFREMITEHLAEADNLRFRFPRFLWGYPTVCNLRVHIPQITLQEKVRWKAKPELGCVTLNLT